MSLLRLSVPVHTHCAIPNCCLLCSLALDGRSGVRLSCLLERECIPPIYTLSSNPPNICTKYRLCQADNLSNSCLLALLTTRLSILLIQLCSKLKASQRDPGMLLVVISTLLSPSHILTIPHSHTHILNPHAIPACTPTQSHSTNLSLETLSKWSLSTPVSMVHERLHTLVSVCGCSSLRRACVLKHPIGRGPRDTGVPSDRLIGCCSPCERGRWRASPSSRVT